MKKVKFSSEEVTGIIQMLELQPAESIGQLRQIDKMCNHLEEVKEGEVEWEDADFNFIRNKINSFKDFNPQKKYRKIILSIADKLDEAHDKK